jgi:hypothetical protein
MARSLILSVATTLALIALAPSANAQTPVHHPHPHAHHVIVAAQPGDIVVHARRSYLDPGPPAWNEVGTGDRYVGDSTPYNVLNDRELGPQFGINNGGFETLPNRFDPPGRYDPLFWF